jgi:hypothetical protein
MTGGLPSLQAGPVSTRGERACLGPAGGGRGARRDAGGTEIPSTSLM